MIATDVQDVQDVPAVPMLSEPDVNGQSVLMRSLSFTRFNGSQHKLAPRTINSYCSFIERINSELEKIGLPNGLHHPQAGWFYWERYGKTETINHILSIIKSVYTIETDRDMIMRMAPLISMLKMVSDVAVTPWLAIKERYRTTDIQALAHPAPLHPSPGQTILTTQNTYLVQAIRFQSQSQSHKTPAEWTITNTLELTDDEHQLFLFQLNPKENILFKYRENNPLRKVREQSTDTHVRLFDKFLDEHRDAHYFLRSNVSDDSGTGLLTYIVKKLIH